MNEKQFKFQVGDIVTCAWLKGEHVLAGYGANKYPLIILFNDEREYSFTEFGFFDVEHELPTLKLVRRPKKEMTFERIKSEGIKKLKSTNGFTRDVFGFSPKGTLLITFSEDEHAGECISTWLEGEIKNWEAVE